MNIEEVDDSTETKRVQFTRGETIEHWINCIPVLFFIYFVGQAFMLTIFSSVDFPILSIILLVLLIIQKLFGQNFKVINLEINGSQFKHSNKAAAILYEWNVITNREDGFVAMKSSGWHWEGIRITVINSNGKLYLNSIVEPSYRANPFTFGSNKKNIRLLLEQYQMALEGADVIELANNEITKRENEFWQESEFNFINTIKRIIGYGLSIFFFGLSIWMILKGKLQGLIYTIIILTLCGNYIYYDLKVIREKKKRRRQSIT